MAPDFNKFLVTEILSDQKTVTYRNLSRALKVHVSAAKCMLFDFHQKQNSKKPGSVQATYLIAGKRKREIYNENNEGTPKLTNGDAPPPSSSAAAPQNSAPESSQVMQASQVTQGTQATEQIEEIYQIPVKTITICHEDSLDSTKERFDKITSIHIYSLCAGRLPDLETLTDNSRQIFDEYHTKEDPLIHYKQYGIIQNPYVRRRKGKRPPNIEGPQPVKDEKPKLKPFLKSASKQETTGEETSTTSRPSSRDSNTTPDLTSKPKPNLKRDGSSLFKAFAKQSAKPKLDRKDTETSNDTKMSGIASNNDEGESEDEAMFLDTNTTNKSNSGSKKRAADVQREKEERAAKLRKMMDDDAAEVDEVPTVNDVTEMDAEPPAAKGGEESDMPDGEPDGDEVAWSDSDTEKKTKVKDKTQAEPDEAPKRRRGKRKVLKKRTMKDEEGFLVTREEEVYESFSEDEPEPATKKPASTPAFPAKSSAPAKGGTQKSSAPKNSAPAVGAAKKKDIMSFFGKK